MISVHISTFTDATGEWGQSFNVKMSSVPEVQEKITLQIGDSRLEYTVREREWVLDLSPGEKPLKECHLVLRRGGF